MSKDPTIKELSEKISALSNENETLQESLSDVRMMMDYEDRGWEAIFGYASGDRTEGLDLEEVKSVSEKARTKVAAASLEKRASDLHGGYVFGNGIEIDGTIRDPKADTRGRRPGEIKFFEDTINQENLFSDSAHKELQRARFTDGNVVVFCDTKTKQVRRIPIYEISGILTHPDHPDEITAWLRTWTHYTPSGEAKTKRAWAYTNRHSGTKATSIKVGNESVKVLQNTVAIDLRANRQVGWTYGIPDALAGMMWTEAYGQVLRYGQIVNESLAKIVYKVISKTQKTASTVGVKLGSVGPGGAAAVGEGQDIQLVNSSQRSFDFTAARPLAAMAASAWNLSNIDLLADSSAAGSSYGAAQTLSAGIQNAMKGMQQDWTQFYADIFEAVGFERPSIRWEPMEEPDAYRMAQELTLYSVALSDVEYRREVLDRLDIPGNPEDIPETLLMRSAEPKSQAASPDQGRNSDAGGADSSEKNDTRTDTISQESLMSMMSQEDILKEMRELVGRIEAAQTK